MYLKLCKTLQTDHGKNKKGFRCNEEVARPLNLFSSEISPQGRFLWARLAQWKVWAVVLWIKPIASDIQKVQELVK